MRRSPVVCVLLSLAAVALPGRRALADDAPKIRAIAPSGATRGQTVDVVMEGSNLAPFDEVKCGRPEISLSAEKSADPHKVTLRMVIPDTAKEGPVSITIKTKTGTATTDRFQVRMRSPTVSKVKPDTVQRGGTVDLAITGANLAFLGQETTLGVEAPMTAAITGKPTDKALTVHLTVPATVEPGLKSIMLTTTDGKVAATVRVELAPPEIVSVSPATIARGASAELKIVGKNLAGVAAPVLALPEATVVASLVGVAQVTGVTLKVSVAPDAAPGPRLFVFTTPDGMAAARIDVTTPVPAIKSVTPAGAARGSAVDLELVLEGAPGAYALRVLPAESGVSIETPKSGRPRLVVAEGALPGPRTLVLDHPFGVATAPLMIHLRGPGITGVVPAELAPGADSEIVFEGERLEGATFDLAAPDPSVTLTPGKKPGTAHVAFAADAKPGPRNLLVRTADGAAIAVVRVAGAAPSAPAIASIVPLRAPRGATSALTVKGSNLRATGDQPPEVLLVAGGVEVPTKVLASTPSSLTVEVSPPAATPLGGCALIVRTPEGTAAGALSVTPATPTILPGNALALTSPGEAKLALAGTFLTALGGGPPTVTLSRADGSGALSVRVDSAKPEALALTAMLDAATPTGAYVLVVRTSEGGAAVPLTVVAAPPEVASIDPTTIGSPANVTFLVRGHHLVGRDGKAVHVAITRLGSAASVDPQVMSATDDALSVRVTTQKGTPPGPHVLVVTTPDGRAAALFRVVEASMPTISSIEPATAAPLTTVTVALKGLGLLGTTQVTFSGAGLTVQVLPGGTDALQTLRVTVAKDAAPGVRTLTIVAPGGVTTAAAGFTVK